MTSCERTRIWKSLNSLGAGTLRPSPPGHQYCTSGTQLITQSVTLPYSNHKWSQRRSILAICRSQAWVKSYEYDVTVTLSLLACVILPSFHLQLNYYNQSYVLHPPLSWNLLLFHPTRAKIMISAYFTNECKSYMCRVYSSFLVSPNSQTETSDYCVPTYGNHIWVYKVRSVLLTCRPLVTYSKVTIMTKAIQAVPYSNMERCHNS